MAALFRALLRISPVASIDNAILIMDVLRMTRRLDLHTRHPETFDGAKHHFDRACVKSMLHFKANGQTCKTWWDAHGEIASLIVPGDAVQTAFACTTDFADTKDILNQIVSSSELGEKMFGRAFQACKSSDVVEMISQSVIGLSNGNLTKEAIDKARADFIKQCTDMGKDPTANFDKQKMATVDYRGVKIPVAVEGFLQEWACHVEAFVKTAAVDTGVLKPLWCESELVPSPRPQYRIEVTAALVKDSALARKTCSDLLETGAASADSIRNIFKQKQTLLRQMDRHFKIEEAFFQHMSGDSAEQNICRL